jgi:chromosome partitioning protein
MAVSRAFLEKSHACHCSDGYEGYYGSPMRILALANQKGGVGKTTTTINIGGALGRKGHRVLLVDLDPQGHLTTATKVPPTQQPATLTEAMLGRFTGDLRELVAAYRRHDNGGLVDVIATNIDMFLLEGQLYLAQMKEQRLTKLLSVFAESYDVCLIDCPPSLGPLTDNALTAARRVLVPVESEDSSLNALELLKVHQLDTLSGHLGSPIQIVGMVVNAYDKRRGQIVTSTLQALRNLPDFEVLAVIDDRKEVREAWRAGLPVVDYVPDHEVAKWYEALGDAVAARIGLVA